MKMNRLLICIAILIAACAALERCERGPVSAPAPIVDVERD